jgi:hypothetical protein
MYKWHFQTKCLSRECCAVGSYVSNKGTDDQHVQRVTLLRASADTCYNNAIGSTRLVALVCTSGALLTTLSKFIQMSRLFV